MFVNAVVVFQPRSGLTPETLLKSTQALEREAGRVPKRVLNEPRLPARRIERDHLAGEGATREGVAGQLHAVARLHIAVDAFQAELPLEAHTLGARLLQMSGTRLGYAGLLGVFHEPDLHGIIAIGSWRLALHHDARSGLDHRNRHYLPVRPEYLRHPDLLP